MKLHARTSRRRFLARTVGAAGALALSGCDALSRTEWFPSVLGAGEKLSQAAHHLLTPRRAMAQEFSAADLSPTFRSNGTAYSAVNTHSSTAVFVRIPSSPALVSSTLPTDLSS